MKKPDIWLQWEGVETVSECGCKVYRFFDEILGGVGFYFCPLHESAEALLEAAKRQVALIESEGMKGVEMPLAEAISFQEALNKLRQAIAKAEGGRK